jgi:predicted nucleotidyltransferase
MWHNPQKQQQRDPNATRKSLFDGDILNTSNPTIQDAIDTSRHFVIDKFPHAIVAFLGGSWARGQAHIGSDLDICVVDAKLPKLFFEGLTFENWIIDLCAIPQERVPSFLFDAARYRSAPIPNQIIDALVIYGDPKIGADIKNQAMEVISRGPSPLTPTERTNLQWELTVLVENLRHASSELVISLAAMCHTRLGSAILDIAGTWRADRKALPHTLRSIDPKFSDRLDQALRLACTGKATEMIEIGYEVLSRLGGPLRTYPKEIYD